MKKLLLQKRSGGMRICAACLAALMLLSCLAACAQSEPITENKITEVRLTGDGADKITVKAQLTENALSSIPSGEKLCLLEYTSDMDVASDTAELDPVAEVKAKSKVDFEIPLYDGVRTRRYSSFAVAYYNANEGKYSVLTPLAAINFSPSDKEEVKAPEVSIKGLATDSVSGALELGVSHALVEVRLENLLVSAWENDAVSYVYDGVTYYMRGSELARIDGLVRTYTDNGVNVYLEFVLKNADGELVNTVSGLALPDAAEASSYLVNMESAGVARRMEGAFDFLALRYSDKAEEDNGLCDKFIIGKNVNNSKRYASCGGLSMTTFISTYEKLVRLADTALATYNSDGHAYVSIDDNWRNKNTETAWNGESFLSAFANEAKVRGDYDWHIACGMYTEGSVVWEENTAPQSITPDTLSRVADLLDVKKYKFNETDMRGVMIHSFEISGDSEDNQAASYVYAYYRALESEIIEAMVYSAHYDTDGDNSGIVYYGSDALKGHKKLYEVFKAVDTDRADVATSVATAAIGLPFTSLASNLGDKAHPVKLVSGTAKSDGSTKGVPVLYSFNGDMHGFEPTAGVKYTEFVYSEGYGTSYLNMSLDADRLTDSEGIYATVSGSAVKGAEEIIMPLYAGSSASAAKSNSVTLRILRPSKGAVADSDGAILYSATASGIGGSVWQNVSFDISELSGKLEGEDTLIISITANTPEAENACFGIKDICVKGADHDAGVLGVIIIIIVLVVLLGIVGALVYFVLKRRGIIGG
ncbi:MAG: hypothetical protein E7589_00125 [Ruminococcaceae bacterium]|nr:hypothetical protein [Oscillospiraceae bacterium]